MEPAGKVNQWKGPAIAFAVFAVIALGAFALLAGGSDELGNEHHAEAACEDFVREKLKSPSSAEFSSVTVTKAGEGEWNVSGTVDAENSFSAAGRMTFECNTWTTDGDTYEGRATVTE